MGAIIVAKGKVAMSIPREFVKGTDVCRLCPYTECIRGCSFELLSMDLILQRV